MSESIAVFVTIADRSGAERLAREAVEGLTAFLVARHDNEVPEVIALPIVGGYAPYLSWIADETAGEETP
jgi:periplasmic divalent cation tolerance protein